MTAQPVPDAGDRLDPVAGVGADRVVCPDCGYHDGQHGENCHIDEWTEAEKRAADGDR